MKNTRSKINSIKTGKELGAMHCFGCKEYIHNFKPQQVKVANKVLREKSICAVCGSSKLRFLNKNTTTKNN